MFPCQELWDLGARKHTIATDTVFTVQNCDWILETTRLKYLAHIWHFDYSLCSALWTQARSRRDWGRNRFSTQTCLLEHPKRFGVLADRRSNSRNWNRIFRPDTKAKSTSVKILKRPNHSQNLFSRLSFCAPILLAKETPMLLAKGRFYAKSRSCSEKLESTLTLL